MSIYFEAEKQEKKCANLKEEVRKIMSNAWGMFICLTHGILLKRLKRLLFH